MFPDKNKKYTYDELMAMDIEGQWELINGVFYSMSPSPIPTHQDDVLTLASALRSKVNCKVYISPLDVLFEKAVKLNDKEIDKVQPDVFILCDESKITDKNIQGSPDFIAEVLSEDAGRDCIVKRELYQKNGVQEYWIIDKTNIFVLILQNGVYVPQTYSRPAVIKLSQFDIEVSL